jgi:hypothetical protein
VTTAPPPLPFINVPLPPTAPPHFAPPSFEQTKQEAREILLAGAEYPLPPTVLRHQDRVLERVYNLLADTGTGCHRLYVLEIAGPIPRVKIGRSNDPRGRIRGHVATSNCHQFGLIDAHVTDPVDDQLSAQRAETEAHIGVGRRHKPMAGSREIFPHADFTFASLWADLAVIRQHNSRESW